MATYLGKKTNPADVTVPAGFLALIANALTGQFAVKDELGNLTNMGSAGTSTPTTFDYPHDGSLTEADSGKIAQVNEDGTCKVYTLSPAVSAQAGSFRVTVDSVTTSPYESSAATLATLTIPSGQVANWKTGDKIVVNVAGWIEQLELTVVDGSAAVNEVLYDASVYNFAMNVANAINGNTTWAANHTGSIVGSYDGEGNLTVTMQNTAPFWFNLAYNANGEGYGMHFMVQSPTGNMFFVQRFVGNPQATAWGGEESAYRLQFRGGDTNGYSVSPPNWRSHAGMSVWEPAENPEAEAEAVAGYLNTLGLLNTTITYTPGNNYFDISGQNDNWFGITIGDGLDYSVTTLSEPSPALPPAPTAYPLGKIVGVTDTRAQISAGFVETYIAAEDIVVNYEDFDLRLTELLTADGDSLKALFNMFIIPTDGGRVRRFDFDTDMPAATENFVNILAQYRHVALGIALSSAHAGQPIPVVNILALPTMLAGTALADKDLNNLIYGLMK